MADKDTEIVQVGSREHHVVVVGETLANQPGKRV